MSLARKLSKAEPDSVRSIPPQSLLLNVLGVLRTFFQEGSEQGLGQCPKALSLPRAGGKDAFFGNGVGEEAAEIAVADHKIQVADIALIEG